jgi:nitrite reductase/ring-hydroxylating ferredoxin subunit
MTDTTTLDLAALRRRAAREIQRRMVAHVAAGGTTDMAPHPMENDVTAYTDRSRAELERRELFLKRPLVVALTQDIPNPGDCLLFEDVGVSIIVVRGVDGSVDAFLNMCTHRGSKLVRREVDGSCAVSGRRFVCPFHAWTFDLNGTLAGIPGAQGFEGLDLAQRNLVRVPAAEWNGLILVTPTPSDDSVNADGYLGSFGTELALLDLASAFPVRSSMLTAATNWKCALDTYGEGYHFATLHASTIGTTHFSNVAVFDAFEPHWRLNFPEKSLRALVRLPEAEWPDMNYGGIHFIFPNVVLVAGALESGTRWVRMFRVFPGVSPGEMICRTAVYVIGGSASDRSSSAFSHDDSNSDVTQEDYQVAVDGYANMVTAPHGFKVVYGRNEPALQAFHRSVASVLGL